MSIDIFFIAAPDRKAHQSDLCEIRMKIEHILCGKYEGVKLFYVKFHTAFLRETENHTPGVVEYDVS